MNKAGLLATLMLLAACSGMATSTESTDVMGLHNQLRTEEQRQRRAGRMVSGAARQIEWLLDDLQANQLYKREDGEATAHMAKQLLALSSGSIPEAASILGRAREDVSGAAPHIKRAEAEVQKILEDLAGILKETTSALAEDRILTHLKALIDDEEALKNHTETWGRKVILDQKAAQADTGRLHRLQSAVIPQYAEFLSLLGKAQGQATQADIAKRFNNAAAALNRSKPDIHIKKAAAGIEQVKPLDAITAQKTVISALREAYEILASGVEDEEFWRKLLEKLVKQQRDVHEAIKDADHGRFMNQQSELLARQMNMNRDMEQLSQPPSPQSAPPPQSPPSPSLPPGRQTPQDQAQEPAPPSSPVSPQADQKPDDIALAEAKALQDQQAAQEAVEQAKQAMKLAQEKIEQANQAQAEQAAAEAAKALEEAQEAMQKSATSSAELASALEETLPNAGEEAPPPSPTAASPGDLPEVSPTDSESETQEDRSSDDPAETAAQGEGEETGDIAGSEMPEGEGEMPGSVGKSETSTGEGDTPIGQPDPNAQPSSSSEKKNPRDPNKPKMPAPAMHATPSGNNDQPTPPDGEMPPTEGAEEMNELGGSSDTEASGEDYELKALAAEVFTRGEKKGGLQEYLPQLPAEYRNQIKDYYEVLAQ